MNKKSLTEADIRTKYITPALTGPDGMKWNVMTQIREEVYFTNGRVLVRGKTVKRGVAKKADYIPVYRPNLPLADQTKTNDFKPFGKAMNKITNRTVDKSYEIYLCLYQAVTGIEEENNIYKQFSPDFFDLIIVDECHRGNDKARSRFPAIQGCI